MKLLKILVSGSFRTEPAKDTNRMPFNGIEITAPFVSEEYYTQVSQRLFPIYLRKNKEFAKVNFEGLIKIFVDSVKEVEGELSFVNKDIKEMSWEELQDMACYFGLREVPLYQIGELRTAREKAYEIYMKVIKKRKVIKSALDMKILKENVRTRCQTLGMDESETQEEIKKSMENIFDMSVDPNNLEKSYNYAKLPSLIALKVDKSQKQ
jgi:hypothetical protein